MQVVLGVEADKEGLVLDDALQRATVDAHPLRPQVQQARVRRLRLERRRRVGTSRSGGLRAEEEGSAVVDPREESG